MKNASIWSVVSLCNDAICAILYRSSKLPTTGSTLPADVPVGIWICFNQLGANLIASTARFRNSPKRVCDTPI
jgi:hypothetical protein